MESDPNNIDLLARWFGVLTGLFWGTVFAMIYLAFRLVLSLIVSKKAINKDVKRSWKQFAFRIVCFLFDKTVLFLTFIIIPTIFGWWIGQRIDIDYYQVENSLPLIPHWPVPILFLITVFLLMITVVWFNLDRTLWKQIRPNRAGIQTDGIVKRFAGEKWRDLGFFVFLFVASLLSCHYTESLARPNLFRTPVKLEEGIYLYANDTVYNVFPLNIYTSRMGGFVHSGLCLLTRRPEAINANRAVRGLPPLTFEKLDKGYFINDFNLGLIDYDGVTNHGSRTDLSDRSFEFDIIGFNQYLAGRSANDLPHPAVRLLKLEVPQPIEFWEKVDHFRNHFNQTIPDGFVYSPIPYDGQYVRLYNCNTVMAAIISEILELGEAGNSLTCYPYSFGGQKAKEGRDFFVDCKTSDFRQRCEKEFERMKNLTPEERTWFYWLLDHRGPVIPYVKLSR